MPKIKSPTPQEIYRAKKEREEQEKVALLPPGLVNHGNTCFMNSVLQGLIATQLLSDLVHFKPIPEQVQKNSSTPLASRRSPLLTNGHNLAGPYEQLWVNSMPLGDIFLTIMLRAWESQSLRKRESLSPKPLLGILGKKYDQYLDFAQQDAHEFMRILLDSIRMEEFDVIKKRQPSPPSDSQRKKRRRTTITPSSFASSDANIATSSSAEPIPEEEKLISFADMVFGGKLTSVLVCQKCKNISHTYEDFNDLSLSMKAEDYGRERKRDRLKTLAKKLKALNPSSPSANTLTVSHSQRASSVPPSPRPRDIDDVELGAEGHPPSVDEPRRRSFDVADQDKDGFQGGHISGVSTPGEEKHVGFLDTNPEKPPKEKDRTSKDWAKLGRRISMTVGLKKAVKETKDKETKERKGRARERESRDLSNGIGAPSGSSSTPRASLPDVARASQPPSKSSSLERLAPPESRPKRPISLQLPPRSAAVPIQISPAILPNASRPKPSKPPKVSSAESAYLRRILADVPPSSSHSPFAMFAQSLAYSGVNGVAAAASASSSQPLWLKPVGKVPSIEECLRLFTAVEVLDNENMVGCRRCWKIENGVYKPAEDEDDEDDDDEGVDQDPEDEEEEDKFPRPNSLSAPSTAAERPILPTSLSTPSISIYSHPSIMSDNASVSSLPTLATSVSDSAVESKPALPSLTVSTTRIPLESQLEDAMSSNPGGLPIPSISTAPPSPEEPTSQPLTARPEGTFPPNHNFGRNANTPLSDTQASHVRTSSNNSLHPPTRRTRTDPDSTDESSEEESDVSLSTSVNSLDSATSDQESANSTGSGNVTSQPAASSKPKAKSKSKPVIMRPAYKRYLIATPPPVLVIHLKRFQQISKSVLSFSSGFKKLDDYVTFPEYLDLTPFLAPRREDFGLDKGGGGAVKPRSKDGQQCMYRLYAVVVHIGSMLGGHYISYTALPQPPSESSLEKVAVDTPPASASKSQRPERQWAYISDTVVRLTSIDEVLKAKAYLCLYERI